MEHVMHEVGDWDDLRQPGDYMFAKRGDGSEFPIIVCPKCRKPGSCSNHTLVQRAPLTITASFLCNQRMPDGSGKRCEWHGWVTNGVMKEC